MANNEFDINGENESEKFVEYVLAQLAFGNYDDVVQTINDDPELIENEEIKEALENAIRESGDISDFKNLADEAVARLSDDVKEMLGERKEKEGIKKRSQHLIDPEVEIDDIMGRIHDVGHPSMTGLSSRLEVYTEESKTRGKLDKLLEELEQQEERNDQ